VVRGRRNVRVKLKASWVYAKSLGHQRVAKSKKKTIGWDTEYERRNNLTGLGWSLAFVEGRYECRK